MSRRVSLPGAAELFRVTGEEAVGEAPETLPAAGSGVDQPTSVADPIREIEARVPPVVVDPLDVPGDDPGTSDLDLASSPLSRPRRRQRPDRRPSGRERHDEKITVYCSPDELLELEHARLVLRGEHGLVVDRGRIVREAVAVVLADLEAKGEQSIIVRRLRGRA